MAMETGPPVVGKKRFHDEEQKRVNVDLNSLITLQSELPAKTITFSRDAYRHRTKTDRLISN